MVKSGEVLLFSPKFGFCDLDFSNAPRIIEAFSDRVEGFYLAPANRLLEARDAFACGLVCCASIDFLAFYSVGKNGSRISTWLQREIPDFRAPDPDLKNHKKTRAERFKREFRDGLAHEGRIKELGQFSLDSPQLITFEGTAMIVNPGLLLQAIKNVFRGYCLLLQTDRHQSDRLVRKLKEVFGKEIAATSAS